MAVALQSRVLSLCTAALTVVELVGMHTLTAHVHHGL